jgi:hypothetical protein
MNSHETSATLENVAGAAPLPEDRRFNTRTKFLKNIRIRHVDPSNYEEMGTMVDLSRDGLYFIARSDYFQKGMELRLTLPHTGSECTCEVMRTERLPNGRKGVGVRILGW